MKLLLTSAGFRTEDIIKTYEHLVGKKRNRIRIAAIEEAPKGETGDMTWFAEEKQRVKANAKEVVVLPLQTQPLAEVRALIDGCDVIYCYGGNADYLTKVLEGTGFATILSEILESKVWVGSSAGSCVLCHKETEQTAREVFQEVPTVDHYLNLVPVVLLPHYHGWFKFEEPEILREAKNSEYPVYALSDQSALKVTGKINNTKLEMVGEDYYINLGGEINRQVSDAVDAAAELVGDATKTIRNLFKKS